MRPIHSAGKDNLSKQSPLGFGPKARHELLQKLRDKGYLSDEEEYTRHTEPIQSLDNGDSVVPTQGLPPPQLDGKPLDKFERLAVLRELRKKGFLSDQEYAHYMWPNNKDHETRESWLKRQKLYEVPINVLELSEKSFKSLIRTGVTTIGDVLHILNQFVVSVIRSDRRFDSRPLDELLQKLRDKGYLSDEEYARHRAGY